MSAETVIFVSRLIVPLCASLVLTAVALNFALAADSGAVKVRTRSPVATASMLAFLLAVYVLIHRHIGDFRVFSNAISAGIAAAGAALVAAGGIVNVLGRIRLGGNWANQVTVYEDQTLVSTGVFGLVRHPLYASLIWMFVGASLVYQNGAALAATMLIFVPAMQYRASLEEQLLARQFPEYASYQTRVGRLFPRIWRKVRP
ncbi:MAG TPA: isoprenylcysteine carboxylmethyltransferase family protein [Armatimonadota bacterium]